jgi:hypothetical protein
MGLAFINDALRHIVEEVTSSLRRTPRNANRLPTPLAAEHALLECRGVLPVVADAGLAVAKVEVGIESGVVARLSIGTHQIVIRVVGMVGLRRESSREQQSAGDDRAFHGLFSNPIASGVEFSRRHDQNFVAQTVAPVHQRGLIFQRQRFIG